jgi:hypothetical protein
MGGGLTHDSMSADGYFLTESIEYIYYDQLGSYYSASPKIPLYGLTNALSRKWSKYELHWVRLF